MTFGHVRSDGGDYFVFGMLFCGLSAADWLRDGDLSQEGFIGLATGAFAFVVATALRTWRTSRARNIYRTRRLRVPEGAMRGRTSRRPEGEADGACRQEFVWSTHLL